MSYVSQELSDLFYEERKWYRAEYEVDGDPDDIKTEDLNDCHYKSLRLVQDKFEKLKAENEAMVKTLPNDMDGYGFDTEKMRWVHCDEESEEEESEEEEEEVVEEIEEEEDLSGYEVYVEEWDDVENVLENGWSAESIRRFGEDGDNRARQYYDELVAQMAEHREWKAVMFMKYGENGVGDVIRETHQDIRQQQQKDEEKKELPKEVEDINGYVVTGADIKAKYFAEKTGLSPEEIIEAMKRSDCNCGIAF